MSNPAGIRLDQAPSQEGAPLSLPLLMLAGLLVLLSFAVATAWYGIKEALR